MTRRRRVARGDVRLWIEGFTARSPRLFDPNLAIIFSVTLIMVMGVPSIAPALPKIGEALRIDTSRLGLVLTVFTAPGIFVTLVVGVLADRFGRKIMVIPSLLLFGSAGFAVFFVESFQMLLFLRFFQGCGAAALGALNVTLIGDLFTPEKRPTVLGYNSAVLSVCAAAYPLIGGALAEIDWDYPFLLPLAAFPAALAVMITLKDKPTKGTESFSLYLSNSLAILKSFEVAALLFASVATFLILYGAPLGYFSVLMNTRFDSSPFIIGLIISGMSASSALVALKLGVLTARFGEKRLLVFGFGCYGFALVAVPFIPLQWLMVFPIALFGVGNALSITTIQLILVAKAPFEYRAIFIAMYGAILRLGQTLGPVFMGVMCAAQGIDRTFLYSSIFAVVSIVLIVAAVPSGVRAATDGR